MTNAEMLLSRLGDRAREELAKGGADVGAWLDASVESARAAFPDVVVEDEDFAAHLAAKIDALPPPAALEKLHTTDLYLASGCLQGSATAIAALDRICTTEVERVVARMRLARSDGHEIHGWMREQLFFPEDREPLVNDYSGRAPMKSWIRSIAAHAALKVKKKGRAHVGDEALAGVATVGTPELEYLQKLHAREFRTALANALAAIDVRERNLLRQHYIDGLTLDAMGTLYKVHRATVARWLSAARGALVEGVRRDLAARLSPSEIESLLRLVRGSLGLQISQLFRGFV